MKPKSAVLVLHFRDNEHTVPCLDSLAKANQVTPFATYVINIQCKKPEVIANHPLKAAVINEERNLGFAWANNLMIKQALEDGYENVILLNNDTTVDKDFIPALEARLKDKKIGMVCPKIYFYPGCEFHHDSYKETERGKVIWYMGGIFDWANVFASHFGVDEVDHGQFETLVDTDFATGCCIAMTKDVITEVGLMNEDYFLYFEDADWSLEVKRKGLRIVIEPKSIIYHKNAGSTGGSGSPLQQYYQTRNRFYFGMKFAPLRTKLHLIRNTFIQLFSNNPVIRTAAKDAFLYRMGIRPFPQPTSK